MISLFAFILVLGIVVDDAIVVGENISNILFSIRKPDFFEILIDIEVRDANHLQNIIAALRMEKEVSSLERLKG